jgi:hypothetical protein
MTVIFGSNPSDDYQNFLWQAYYAEQERLKQEFYLQEQAKQAEQEKAAQTAVTGQTAAAQQAAPYTPPSGTERLASLTSLLPPGFETSLAPSSLVDPYVEQAYTGARSTADEYLSNMLKRGTITPSGYSTGVSALDVQAPDIRQKYQDLGDLLISQEQAGLRGIASEGQAAAEDVSQTSFDPSTYKSQVEKNVSDFTSGLPSAYSEQVSSRSPQIAFNLSNLGATTGAVQSPQGIQADPYASNIGSATASDETAPPPSQKRKASVF